MTDIIEFITKITEKKRETHKKEQKKTKEENVYKLNFFTKNKSPHIIRI